MYSEKDAAEMLQQVMSSIEYCHNNGICHRDLKPDNLLYLNKGPEKNNPIKVIDFGLSQFISDQKLTTKVGTAYYVSPEILKGDYTEKCDIWSAGVILYIFLSGDPPFNGPNDNAIYQKIAQMKFAFPEKKWKNISNDAKDLIMHMISPEKERYTAKQVLEHPWFKNASTEPLNSLNFDPVLFKGFVRGPAMKKMSLLYIASRLDENEIENLKKVFKSFDKCSDGQITYDELKQGLIQFNNTKLTENEIKDLFSQIDVDQNGKIDYTEFIAATVQESNYNKKEKIFEAFSMFDKDNSGFITKDEILNALKAQKSQEKEIEKYIQDVDKNGDGKIDYKEFVELMGSEK
jgi:calcium-dependent protein kinase